MTTIRHCEYELLRPHDDPWLEADAPGLVHPDPAVTACAATEARRSRPRRFVFYTALDRPSLGRRQVTVLYQGFVNSEDGSVVLLHNGHPVGWYRSVGSAWHRIRLQNTVWLAWLEPDPADAPADFNIVAEREATHGEPSTWYISVPFTALGREDARMRASDITGFLETCLPGVDRLDVTFGLGDDPAAEAHVFCEQPGCPRPPGHHGEHRLPRGSSSSEPGGK